MRNLACPPDSASPRAFTAITKVKSLVPIGMSAKVSLQKGKRVVAALASTLFIRRNESKGGKKQIPYEFDFPRVGSIANPKGGHLGAKGSLIFGSLCPMPPLPVTRSRLGYRMASPLKSADFEKYSGQVPSAVHIFQGDQSMPES